MAIRLLFERPLISDGEVPTEDVTCLRARLHIVVPFWLGIIQSRLLGNCAKRETVFSRPNKRDGSWKTCASRDLIFAVDRRVSIFFSCDQAY